MTDGVDIKLTGASDLHDALGQLKKSTERAVLRRVAIKALQPIVDAAKRYAPVAEGDLRDSIAVGTKLTSRAKRAARADPVEGVRVFAGSADRNAVPREFGSVRSPAHPFMRPAWLAGKIGVLESVMSDLAGEIEKAAKRAKKKG